MLKHSRDAKPRTWLKRSVVAVASLMLAPLGVAVTSGVAPAQAAFNPSGYDVWVTDPVMGPIKSRVFPAKDGNKNRVVYALDGMRAQGDLNGWEKDTNVARVLQDWNINVVMPVGGQSSFYADWNAPSSDALSTGSGASSGSAAAGSSGTPASAEGKRYRYNWETFLTTHLRNELGKRGFKTTRNGVFGLSMGGSAALTLAAWHPEQFSFAGSFSGYTNLSAPGMRELMRGAMFMAGGYNSDAFAPPMDVKWLRNDPFMQAVRLRNNNTRIFISSGSGVPSGADAAQFGIDVFNMGAAMGLETLGLANTRAFEVRLASVGARNFSTQYPPQGVHNWRNWEGNVYHMIPDLSRNIG